MEIFKESSIQRDKFRSAANKLLNHCFLVKKREDLRSDYIFVLQHRELFEEYFDLLGYELKVNENSGVIGVVNILGTGRLRLKKTESILLLILRLLYIEKKKELALNDEVVVRSEEIQEKYNMLRPESRANIEKTVFRETLRLFRRYNLVTILDADITKADARIIIYPSVLFAVPAENINEMHEMVTQKLNNYINGGTAANDEDSDEDQADQLALL